MLDYSIMLPEGILVLNPSSPLTKEDFSGVSDVVDAYLSDHTKLQGVLIHSKIFPGWKNFGGFAEHMHFVSEHHKQVKRIAVVTDSWIAGIAESLGKHFTSAQIMHFPFSEEPKALEWLKAA